MCSGNTIRFVKKFPLLINKYIFTSNHFLTTMPQFTSTQNRQIYFLIACSCLFTAGLLSSNFLAAKVICVGGLEMPSATVGYALTYLMTDVIGELYGKKIANRIVQFGFICLVVACILTRLALLLPSPYDSSAFSQVFSTSTRIFVASIAAYIISQSTDVYIFHKIRSYSPKFKFIRNNISTIASQFLDTIIFSFIAFYGIVPNIWSMVWGVFIAKVVLALCDTPFFYLLTRKRNEFQEI